MTRPNFFIVGAPKCGTSAAYTFLREHPDVWMPDQKEPVYFGRDLSNWGWRYRDDDAYLKLFAGARDESRVGEASTLYFFSELAPAEIEAFSPGSRIVVMLRDPVELMRSLHAYQWYWGNEDVADFEEALEIEPHRRVGARLPPNADWIELILYREAARYAKYVRRYLDVFGERVLVIITEELRRAPERELGRLLDHLGLDRGSVADVGKVNPTRTVRSRRLHEFIYQPPAWVQRVARAVMPDRLRIATFFKLRALNTSTVSVAPLRPELLVRLRADLAAEVRALEAILDRDLSIWGYPSGEAGLAATT